MRLQYKHMHTPTLIATIKHKLYAWFINIKALVLHFLRIFHLGDKSKSLIGAAMYIAMLPGMHLPREASFHI